MAHVNCLTRIIRRQVALWRRSLVSQIFRMGSIRDKKWPDSRDVQSVFTLFTRHDPCLSKESFKRINASDPRIKMIK